MLIKQAIDSADRLLNFSQVSDTLLTAVPCTDTEMMIDRLGIFIFLYLLSREIFYFGAKAFSETQMNYYLHIGSIEVDFT